MYQVRSFTKSWLAQRGREKQASHLVQMLISHKYSSSSWEIEGVQSSLSYTTMRTLRMSSRLASWSSWYIYPICYYLISAFSRTVSSFPSGCHYPCLQATSIVQTITLPRATRQAKNSPSGRTTQHTCVHSSSSRAAPGRRYSGSRGRQQLSLATRRTRGTDGDVRVEAVAVRKVVSLGSRVGVLSAWHSPQSIYSSTSMLYLSRLSSILSSTSSLISAVSLLFITPSRQSRQSSSTSMSWYLPMMVALIWDCWRRRICTRRRWLGSRGTGRRNHIPAHAQYYIVYV